WMEIHYNAVVRVSHWSRAPELARTFTSASPPARSFNLLITADSYRSTSPLIDILLCLKLCAVYCLPLHFRCALHLLRTTTATAQLQEIPPHSFRRLARPLLRLNLQQKDTGYGFSHYLQAFPDCCLGVGPFFPS